MFNKRLPKFTPAPYNEEEAKRRQYQFDTGYVLIYMGRKIAMKGFELAKKLKEAKQQDNMALGRAIEYLFSRTAAMTTAFDAKQKADYQKKTDALDRFIRFIMEGDESDVNYALDVLTKAVDNPVVIACSEQEYAAYENMFNEKNPTAPTIQQFAHIEKLIKEGVRTNGSLEKAFDNIWQTVYNRAPKPPADHWKADAEFKNQHYTALIIQRPDGYYLSITVHEDPNKNQVLGPYGNLSIAKSVFSSKIRTKGLTWHTES